MNTPGFKDHFSGEAAAYARYRPQYPPALFTYLSSLPSAQECAWDCGTGSGQAAIRLAQHFQHIIATDPSAEQLAQAPQHPRVTYRVEPAELSSIPDHSIDLVTVAQAIHWFDLPRFYAEVRRVLKPRGILAAWTYSLLQITPEVDVVLQRYHRDIVGPYWPPERRYVEDAYRCLPFPFPEYAPPAFHLETQWDLPTLLGYLTTWSSRKQFLARHSTDPIDLIRMDLQHAWGQETTSIPIRWPLHLRVGWMP